MLVNKYEKCYECGSSSLSFGQRDHQIKVGTHAVTVQINGYTCNKCGEQWMWCKELMLAELRAAQDVFSSNVTSTLTYRDVKFARKALDMSVVKFAHAIKAPGDVNYDCDMRVLVIDESITSAIRELLEKKLNSYNCVQHTEFPEGSS